MKNDSTITFGFWAYLMTDLVLFASLFATYAVLRANTFGGPSGADIFSGSFALTETLILLTSSFTIGLSMVAMQRGVDKKGAKTLALVCMLLTAILGIAFISMELSEFARLIASGAGPQTSGFLSAYFTLVGTHGLHIIIGLIWMIVLMVAIMRRGLTAGNMRKLVLLSTFWHFLDLVWIFIFTIVYLLGII
jgi:cytochrome o ubiquinol oxidase subunit 3